MVRKKLSQLKTWRSRLNFAIKNKLSQEERSFLQKKVCDWKCCAVGEHRAALERVGIAFHINGRPVVNSYSAGHKADDLGIRFARLIVDENYVKANKILFKIEQLSTKSR